MKDVNVIATKIFGFLPVFRVATCLIFWVNEYPLFTHTTDPTMCYRKLPQSVSVEMCVIIISSLATRMLTTTPLVKLYQVTEIFFLPSSMFPSVQLIPCSAYTKHSKICFCGENLTEQAMHLSDLKANILLTTSFSALKR